MADVCRVKNLGSQPLIGAYDSQPYRIDPEETGLLDVECAKKDFGDWTLRNWGEGKNFRFDEFQRIRGLKGIMEGSMVPTGNRTKEGTWEEVPSNLLLDDRMPKVEITLMDGSKVITVLEDPEGRTLPLENASQVDQAHAIESMQEQIAKLTDALDSMKNQQAHVEIPKDTPQSKRPQQKKSDVVGSQIAAGE